MFERYSDDAIKTIMLAQHECAKAKHAEVTPLHLVLGITTTGQGDAYKALKDAGLTAKALRQYLIANCPQVEAPQSLDPPFSSVSNVVLRAIADNVRENTVTNTHLLLILLDQTLVTTALSSLAIDVLKLKQSLVNTLKGKDRQANSLDAAMSAIKGDKKEKESMDDHQHFWSRFTDLAIKVVMIAGEESRLARYSFVGTEQLLLGLLGASEGIAHAALSETGLTVYTVRKQLESEPAERRPIPPVEIPFTDEAKRALELGWDQARTLSSTAVGDEHLLLGLLNMPEGSAVATLKALEIDYTRLREVVLAKITEKQNAKYGFKLKAGHQGPLDFATVYARAKAESKRTGHNYIAVEQLLVGILSVKNTTAHRLLLEANADIYKIRDFIESKVPQGQDKLDKELPLKDSAKLAYGEAWNQVLLSKTDITDIENLLLAVLRSGPNLAIDALTACGVDVEILEIKLKKAIKEARDAKGKPAKSADQVPVDDLIDPQYSQFEKGIFDWFSKDSVDVISLAQDEAHATKQEFVGSEHLLLGLIAFEQGLPGKIFQKRNITLAKSRETIAKLVGPGKSLTRRMLPFSAEAKKILERSFTESGTHMQTKVQPEHLLLAIFRTEESLAMLVLKELNIDVLNFRKSVLEAMENPTIANLYSAFTQTAIKAITLSWEEMLSLNGSEVAPEHIFVALLQTRNSLAYQTLNTFKLNLADSRAALKELMPKRNGPAKTFTTPDDAFIQLVSTEAQKLGHSHIGTEHFLLAVLSQEEKRLDKFLHKLKVKRDELRSTLMQLIDNYYKNAGPDPCPPDDAIEQRGTESSDFYDWFDSESINVLQMADREAKVLKHRYVAPVHLLLGLLFTPNKAHKLLEESGVQLVPARIAVKRTVPPGKSDWVARPMNPAANKSITTAWELLRKAKQKDFTPEHILQGLLLAPDEDLLKVLETLGVDTDKLKDRLEQTL